MDRELHRVDLWESQQGLCDRASNSGGLPDASELAESEAHRHRDDCSEHGFDPFGFRFLLFVADGLLRFYVA
ncbi:MAG: hypothetical protein ACI9MB_003066, partial [Verrucomicrobiales bacterium]